MSSFHCPIGVTSYGDSGCINCGLCQASTMQESRAAAEKMRDYIQNSAEKRDTRSVRKICVCGKGGVGKSTLTALIALVFLQKGYRTLVIDTDESNPSLFRKLGLWNEPKPLISYLERFSMEYGIPEGTWLSQDELLLEEIPEEFLVTDGQLSLMETGKIEEPFQGCACSMADFSRQLMYNLSPREKEVVIVDLEAGVESFGRGVEQGVDTIITVVEPSYDSIRLAKTIKEMANGIGIRRVAGIVNKLPDRKIEALVLQEMEKMEIPVLLTLFLQEELLQLAMSGAPLTQQIQAYQMVEQAVDKLLQM